LPVDALELGCVHPIPLTKNPRLALAQQPINLRLGQAHRRNYAYGQIREHADVDG
jgi:hypothetical protein